MRLHRVILACAAVMALSACVHAVELGHAQEVHSVPGRHEGYSAEWCSAWQNAVVITGSGRTQPTPEQLTGVLGLEELQHRGLLTGGDDWCQFQISCGVNGLPLLTPSFRYVDSVVERLGQGLSQGDYNSTLVLHVKIPEGSPADVHTVFGDSEGYSVAWCTQKPAPQRFVVVTGHGSHPLPMEVPSGVAYSQFLQDIHALLMGSTPEPLQLPTAFLEEGCGRKKAYVMTVYSYHEVDRLVQLLGRKLKEGDFSGEVVVRVLRPACTEAI
jgi:hypothetical protein